jgi:lipopolysaccharide/colanic/teichoic acid biosynthesis glycosyltransferase
VAKRALDLLVAGTLLVLLSPVFAVVLAAYVLDCAFVPADRGPLFYRETRVSRGRRFDLLKFRTLKRDVLAQARGRTRATSGT